ncbi:MAG: ImmA/IrrE family metallo-endopeptidase [Acidobacteria bacterium]|nr:ImmA/IrrE family metallo-endopeptidase [Acidobacteriota bacterium]
MTIRSDQRNMIEAFQQYAPVNVTELAESLGLKVWEDDELPVGVSGKICLDSEFGGSSGYSVIVRASDPFVRRRFTVAHEIAHFLLHKDKIGASLTDDGMYRSRNLSTWEEVEANQLAADILMPMPLISRYINSVGADPATLAALFKVSEQAMRIRLKLPQ